MPGDEPRLGCLPTKVVDVDLAGPIETIRDLQGYTFVLVVARLGVEPVGTVRVPVHGDRCPAPSLAAAIGRELGPALLRVRLLALLETPAEERRLTVESMVAARPNGDADAGGTVSITVAVCTRDRPDRLDRCLAAMRGLRHQARILIVDNAPSTTASARLVAEKYPECDYVIEPRPGLDHARNRAIADTTTDVIAFTDDDVVVDGGWTGAVAGAFAEQPDLAALTGLVLPYELETPAQQVFERLGGFGRGFVRRWETDTVSSGRVRTVRNILGAGQFGTGANMAFRRSVFDRIGGFDPALDVGTPTGGGGDLEMFHRVLVFGETLRYEPAAIVFHEHRRTLDELTAQIRGNGSMWAVMRAAREGGRATAGEVRTIIGWYVSTSWPRQILRSFVVPNRVRLSIPLAEITGMVAAATTRSYHRSRLANPEGVRPPILAIGTGVDAVPRGDDGVTVAVVDVAGPITVEIPEPRAPTISVLVTRGPAAIGRVDVETGGRPLCDRQLREMIVDELGTRVLSGPSDDLETVREEAERGSVAAFRVDHGGDEPPPVYAVSIVVATLDRPESLAQCMASLRQHRSRHRVEIVVVDNNPASGLSAPVLARHPGVVRVSEPRRGLAYARNAGFLAATGDIVVTTDDDVQVPDGWLDLLLQPFERNDVMAVCGNIQPFELRNGVQLEFERMGDLSKGFDRLESSWEHPDRIRKAFAAWDLGATANAAFRAAVFGDPEVGLMDEALGPGMPSGVGEDSYLLYRVVRAGYTVVYEPSAYVLHRHRDTAEALSKQLTAYYSGHVAHNLTTLARDRDPRSLVRLAKFATYATTSRARSLAGVSAVSDASARAQWAGAVRGPMNYVRSQRRVRREGRSATT